MGANEGFTTSFGSLFFGKGMSTPAFLHGNMKFFATIFAETLFETKKYVFLQPVRK
jgi:hypothetical protein